MGQVLPSFELPVLGGEGQLTSKHLRGSYTLLNVWASWCEACSEEQDFLMQLSQAGIHIVGMNYKDDPKAAKAWLETWGNPYEVVGRDITGGVAIDLGVYGTPETFLIGPDGRLLLRHAGILTPLVWKKLFQPVMV